MKRAAGFVFMVAIGFIGAFLSAFAQGNSSVYLPLVVNGTLWQQEEGAIRVTGNANGGSWGASVDDVGARVAFVSDATNLAGNDRNGVSDIYVWERMNNGFRRASVGFNGADPNGGSSSVVISGNGRYVVYVSWADNLVAEDTNGQEDVFRYDLLTGETERVSEGGVVGGANAGSHAPDISADGRWVVFTSTATDMVMTPYPTDCTPGPCRTIFLRDMEQGITEVLVKNADGTAAVPLAEPVISDDGQRVAYGWEKVAATEHYGVFYETFIYQYHRATGGNQLIVSPEGNHIFPDGYCRMPVCGHINLDPPTMSGDGNTFGYRKVSHGSSQHGGNDTYGIYVRRGGSTSTAYEISTDWLISGCDPLERTPTGGTLSDIAFSKEGAVYAVVADDLHMRVPPCGPFASPYFPDDTNGAKDVYVYGAGWAVLRISSDENGLPGNGFSEDVAMSGDGHTIAYTTNAGNVAPGDANGGIPDIVIWSWK